MAGNEISFEQQGSAEEGKQAEKSKKDEAHPPLLIEFVIMLSAIILVVVFLTVVLISLLTGATLLDFVLRTSISILIIGGLLAIITRQISAGVFAVENEKHNTADGLDMQSPSEVK